MNQKRIQNLSSTGRHQECLQACQQLLVSEPENPPKLRLAPSASHVLVRPPTVTVSTPAAASHAYLTWEGEEEAATCREESRRAPVITTARGARAPEATRDVGRRRIAVVDERRDHARRVRAVRVAERGLADARLVRRVGAVAVRIPSRKRERGDA